MQSFSPIKTTELEWKLQDYDEERKLEAENIIVIYVLYSYFLC